MIKPPARYYDDFTARSRLFGKQRDYSHGYRVIRIRGGKDENLNVRDGNRSSKKTRITLTNFAVIRAPSCFLFLCFYFVPRTTFSLSQFSCRFFPNVASTWLQVDDKSSTCCQESITLCYNCLSSIVIFWVGRFGSRSFFDLMVAYDGSEL